MIDSFSKYSRRLLIAAGLALAAGGAFAQSSATTTANATATVIRPITVVSSADLAFGNVVPGASLGTLVVAATSGTPTATASGGVTQPGTQFGTITAAKFDVGGEGGFTYTITLPTGAATISDAGAVDSMTVDNFTSSIVVTAGALSNAIGSAGTQTFYVGGTLNVAANQPPSNYTGTFSVTVAYN